MIKITSQQVTTGIVVAAHAAFICWLAFGAMDSLKEYKPKQRLLVNTVTLMPKIEEVVAVAPPVEKPKQETKPVSKPKKKEQPKSKPKPKPQRKKDAKAKADEIKKQKLLAKAQESIAKIQQAHVKMDSNSSDTPGKIGSLKIDHLTTEEIGYKDELADRLRRDLTLPEEGEVQLKLTLTRAGAVKRLEIVNAKSEKNRKYLETAIKGLKFPSFGNSFGATSEYTFSLTLTNE